MKKIKKIIFSFLIFLNSTVSNVLGQALYAVAEPAEPYVPYVEEETTLEKIVLFLYDISQKIAIPIILLIGIIIYFVKSKKSVKHKIMILLVIAGLYLIFRVDIYLICENITYIFDL